jgi:hypothetical protein
MESDELEQAYHKLLVMYFDCDERVDHEIMKESIDEIVLLMDIVRKDYTKTKHKML